MWRGGLGSAYLFSASFVWRCLNSLTMLRFHIPLVEPDVRFSRIRLSDKASCVRPRKVACRPRQPNQTQGIVEIFIRETCISPGMSLVFGLQPLAEPKPGVGIHTSVGFADRSQTEVSGPPHKLAVEVGDQVIR